MKKIKLMAEYQCFPLWNYEWNSEIGESLNINPDDLPMSLELKKRLMRWAHNWDKTLDMNYPLDSKLNSIEEELDFIKEVVMILKELRKELGKYGYFFKYEIY